MDTFIDKKGYILDDPFMTTVRRGASPYSHSIAAATVL